MAFKSSYSSIMMKAGMLFSLCQLIMFTAGAQPVKGKRADNKVFTVVEHPASFPGGDKAFTTYMSKSIKYPQAARDLRVRGKVDLTFVVEKDGSLSDIKVVRGLGSGCDEEAVRVLKASPKWTPAKQKGRIVRQQYNLPVRFSFSKV